MTRRECVSPGTKRKQEGLTLFEVLLAALLLAMMISAIMGAYLGQLTLNEHARNLAFAINDANRVLEDIRNKNTGCVGSPNATPTNFTSWDGWLNNLATDVPAGGGPKSLQPTTTSRELVVVTCVRQGAPTPPGPGDYCEDDASPGDPGQVGAGEWTTNTGDTAFNPIDVYVSVCWRHRGRTIGECTFNAGPGTLTAVDGSNGPNTLVGIIESPAMVSTSIACF